jgi:hypothetical protein
MRNGVRSWLLAILSPLANTLERISVDLGGGVGIAVTAELWVAVRSPVVIAVVAGVISALVACCGISLFLLWLEEVTTRGLSPLRRRALLVVCGVLFALVVWMVGPGAVWAGVTDAFVAVLPAAFLLVFGIWACLLTQRRVRASRYRWVRYATDVLVAGLTGLGLLALFDRDLLVNLSAAGLLFPVGAWSSIQTWRVMAGSRRPEVRAGADIVLSLLLGADLVLFLVWGANLLDLPEAEVAVLRGTLERVGSIADLPWPLWVVLYVVLAVTSLAFARWPQGLAAVTRWFQRLHVVPSIDVSRRVLGGVHISLLVIVLIGLTGPASLEATLRGPLKAKYTVALQREMESHGEQAVYDEIRRQFTTGTNTSTSPSVQPLVAIVSKIHSISSPPSGTSDASSTERDLARRLGQIQATTLQLTATNSVLTAQQAVTNLAQFAPPIRNAGDLNTRLNRLDTQQRRADTATRRVNQLAELAATAVANIIQIPNLGENEIIQIIREYLSGLVENSPLTEVFAAWAERLTGNTTPPRADKMVVPDPEQLEQAALTVLTQEQTRVQIADPSTPDPVKARTQTEASADAAVDLVNEARYLDEHTGPCDGCPQPLRPGDEHHHRPGDHPGTPGEPVEPVEPVEPRFPFGW